MGEQTGKWTLRCSFPTKGQQRKNKTNPRTRMPPSNPFPSFPVAPLSTLTGSPYRDTPRERSPELNGNPSLRIREKHGKTKQLVELLEEAQVTSEG